MSNVENNVRSGGVFEDTTAHQKWLAGQGVPIHRQFSVPNLKEVEVQSWSRFGSKAKGAYLILDGAEGMNDAYVLEIAPGGTVDPEKHMYEEFVYVVAGQGTATVWNAGSTKKSTFEWKEGSLFSVPLNAWHQFKNDSSVLPARFYVVSSAPLLMNLFHDMDYIFNCDYAFTSRFNGEPDFFSGEGRALSNLVWETNFIEDVREFPLVEWKERGGGGIHRKFELANSTLTAHVSQFPVGTYKKSHRHGAGANVIIIKGKGYSLLWEEGKEDQRVKVDWEPGSVLVPPEMWFHQHFNTGAEPAAYLAIRWGSKKYPLFRTTGERAKVYVSVKEGGSQIDYADEDPSIHQMFDEELRKNGVQCRMSMFHQGKE